MTGDADPYRAPESALDLPTDYSYLLPASLGRRFCTMLVDMLCRMVFFGVLLALAALVVGPHRFADLSIWQRWGWGILSMFAYYVAFEAAFARTPGKFVCGTIVIDERGGPPSFKQVLGRTLARFVPFEAFSFFGEQPTGWHDTWSRTRVVRITPRG